MSQKLYLDVHILQVVPPSNINRDDTGSPKQARFGGVARARVSSQSWKRATRKEFWEGVDRVDKSTRTKRVHEVLTSRLVERGSLEPEVAARVATVVLGELGLTADKKPKKGEATTSPELSYLLFFGLPQIDGLVDDVVATGADLASLDEAGLKAALADVSAKDRFSNGHPLDVALFGRMVADLAALNVDAAAQVAHAISTHAVNPEFDYFTAVDDEKDPSLEGDLGAAMIGTVEFNSSTLYRYATVGIHQLSENLGGSLTDAADAVGRFVDAFVRSMPTGKQNTFANRTLPSVVVVALRSDQPVNLVSAFENPVTGSQGLLEVSARRLADEFLRVQEQWATDPVAVLANYSSSLAPELEEPFGASEPFPSLVSHIVDAVRSNSSGQAGS